MCYNIPPYKHVKKGVGTMTVLSAELAEAITHHFKATIQSMIDLGDIPRDLSIIVLDPRDTDTILVQLDMGNKKHWRYKYDEIALNKARLSAKHRMDSGTIIRDYPHLLVDGDTRFRGGVYHKGIPAAISGLPSHLDESFARSLVELIIGFCSTEVLLATQRADNSDANTFMF